MTRRDLIPAAALAAQAALQVLWHAWLLPPQSVPIAIASSVALFPMLALVPAALHSGRRVLLVGGIVSLLYFCHGVMEIWSDPAARWLAGGEITLALVSIFGLRKVPRTA